MNRKESSTLSNEPIMGGFVVSRPKPIPHSTTKPPGFTLMSDLHIGASNVDYKRIDKEIATAKERGDRVLVNGDVLDLILTMDHKRFSPDVLHPRLQGRRDIVNEAVNWAADIFEPVVDHLDVVACGNHETSLLKYSSYDPTMALIYELEKRRKDKSHIIHHGGYTGFVDYRIATTSLSSKHRGGIRFVIYYHHGSGASSPVTKGMIDFNRKDTFVDADVIWLGHKHNRLNVAVEKLSCPMMGHDPNIKEVRHIMTGAYFHTYRGQTQQSIRKDGRRTNYASEFGMAPQGKGGCRMELFWDKHTESGLEMKVIQ